MNDKRICDAMQAEQLTEMWTMAMQLGPEGKDAALQAALTFISRAAPPVATVFTGIAIGTCLILE